MMLSKAKMITMCIVIMIAVIISFRLNPVLWLKIKANFGDVDAMMELGEAYESRIGGGIVNKPNTKKAIQYYREAAEKGYTPVMYVISQMLTLSISTDERIEWLKKGAYLGDEACIIELINAHREGRYCLKIDKGAVIYWELKRGEFYLKRDGKSAVEIRGVLHQWEKRFREEEKYTGPIRPLE